MNISIKNLNKEIYENVYSLNSVKDKDKLSKMFMDNRNAYNKNFEKILKCKKGSVRHLNLTAEEERLHRYDRALRFMVGLQLVDPCPLINNANITKDCHDCSGYYETRTIRGYKKKKERNFLATEQDHKKEPKRYFRCKIKDLCDKGDIGRWDTNQEPIMEQVERFARISASV